MADQDDECPHNWERNYSDDEPEGWLECTLCSEERDIPPPWVVKNQDD